ncbi:MAG: hypothetical protein KAU48_02915 [Candidatus Thorarchaeota archaeon]|nr:hypothetical protein [Candidatus Thorarchaeota archaeon]
MTKGTLVVLLVIAGVGSGGFAVSMAQTNALSIDYQALAEQYAILLANYSSLLSEHENLTEIYGILSDDYDTLSDDYSTLFVDYSSLETDYATLLENYEALETAYYDLNDLYLSLLDSYLILDAKYSAISSWIGRQILPVQMFIWSEAVRQYYLDDYYLDLADTTKETYMEYARFCRDLILHGSYQYDAFSEVSDAFDMLEYGSNTMALANAAMNVMGESSSVNFPYYYWGTSFKPENWGLEVQVQDCIDNVDYEYDSDITYQQDFSTWDYPKHPVETSFRQYGDCEDQAILLAAMIERNGWFETIGETNYYYDYDVAFAVQHDPAHPTLGSFYHGTLLVHIEDTDDFDSRYPSGTLWSLPDDPYEGYTWCWLDPTWDVPFGSIPSWLQDYRDYGGLTSDVVSIAYCSIGGSVV